jgi:glycosyltransferase involved in cell wall biosynthesis
MELSIIVPFHRNLPFLERCLDAITPLPPNWELIIAGDAPVDDCRDLAARVGARVLLLNPGPNGPAFARNRAAEIARGRTLVFIDADVVTSREALTRVEEIFRNEPQTAAVFGAYDESPADPGFISQYKNLAHSFIHQSAHTVANTFWAGFGAVRTDAFLAVGGFDERFRRPCVEDIDLGYRLTRAGYRLVLDHTLRACHLKRWTLRGMIVSDIVDRGIPWTQLILRFGRFNSDLNLKSSYRACVVLAYLMLAVAVLGLTVNWNLMFLESPMVAALVLLSPRYYRFFLQRRGLWFVLRVFPVHYLYHLYNGFSFVTGTALFTLNRSLGMQLPGALPIEPWETARVRIAPRGNTATASVAAPVKQTPPRRGAVA